MLTKAKVMLYELWSNLAQWSLHVPYLKQNLRAHTKETVDDSEGKDHGHAVYKPERSVSTFQLKDTEDYVQAKEPWQ
jgi:hypothetical protein